jgi:predicted nucleic acid-binding protein
MSSIVILDSGPIGLLAQRKGIAPADACRQWQRDLLASGVRVILPEITDYEVRRELLCLNSLSGLMRLDQLATTVEYLPITTAAMRKAAELWAIGRQTGQPTADPKELDGDVILAAQTILLSMPDVVVATTNVGHLSRFVHARRWQDVS